MSTNAVVIVAAGRGARMGDDGGPKQYRTLGDQTVLQKTVGQFCAHPDINWIQVVIHPDDTDMYQASVHDHPKLLPPVTGGKTRQISCKLGVDALTVTSCERVLIHDAARPFVDAAVISNVLEGIEQGICTLPATPVSDTVKKVDENGFVTSTINRENLHLAQTPQGFMWQEIRDAHENAQSQGHDKFTDDAAVAEWAGLKVRLVTGDRRNFKITTSQDLQMAQNEQSNASHFPDVRTGSGYDVHTLGPGDSVILCGVTIPHTKSLQGHSDADVGLHALTDALLGTIGAGDIGSHFPPSDPQWKGASSDRFLKHACDLVKQARGSIMNLDVTLICEAPKIGPHRDKMRQRIADICELELERVSVKATTNERIGFIGREEGIAALSTASVSFSQE